MTQLVRIALVGAGEIGAVHARAHAAVPGNRLAVVYDVNAEQARRLAEQAGAVVAPSLESVLDDPHIDGVDLRSALKQAALHSLLPASAMSGSICSARPLPAPTARSRPSRCRRR